MSGRALLLALLAFAAALGGAYAARLLIQPEHHAVNDLHILLYEELDLTDDQLQRLKKLEAGYMADKGRLEQAMRDDNARLAKAIAAEHGYGAGVEAAVDRSHHNMGELQKVTLEHVFAMRGVLTPPQAARYDRAVIKTLTETRQ